jgi:type II secretory ATPase GspE/PulE/Tfp pilus assembly ATPase PilB-like protein
VALLQQLGLDPDRDVSFYPAIGCAHCNGGYRGRVGVFQLMVMNDELRRLAAASAAHVELEAAALRAGTASLQADGLRRSRRA